MDCERASIVEDLTPTPKMDQVSFINDLMQEGGGGTNCCDTRYKGVSKFKFEQGGSILGQICVTSFVNAPTVPPLSFPKVVQDCIISMLELFKSF